MINVKFWGVIMFGQLKIVMSNFLPTKLKLTPQLKIVQVQIPRQNLSCHFGNLTYGTLFLYLWHILELSSFHFCLSKCIITVPYLFSYYLFHASKTQYRGAGHGLFYRDMIISDYWVNVTCSYSSFRHPIFHVLLMDWEDH